MAVSLGSSAITAAYLGGNAISKIYLGIIQAWPTGSAWSPLTLFAAGEQGAWYDPSDMSTLYEDAAGTTQVPRVERPIGKMLDKSGRGNHATTPGAASPNFTGAPVLSALYNLLKKTEQFSDAAWGRTSVTVTEIAGISPDATSASLLAFSTSTAEIYQLGLSGTQASGAFKVGVYLRGVTGGEQIYLNANEGGTIFSARPTNCQIKVTLTTSWQFYSLPFGTHISGGINGYISLSTVGFGTNPNLAPTSIYAWGADLRLANDGVGLPSYQRVVTPTTGDYNTTGFPSGAYYEGSNSYSVAAAGGGATNAFFFCAAIRLGKTGAAQTIFSDTGTNTGYRIRINASNQLEFSAGNGSSFTTVATTATLGIGERAVVTCWHDGVNLKAQINSGAVASTAFETATAGTAQVTYAKDNNASFSFFKGSIYETVYAKRLMTDQEITSSKSFCAAKGLVTL